MYDIRKSLPFLKRPGLFFEANHQIADLPMDELHKMFLHAIKQSDLTLANLVAEKMSILYGIHGLTLYFDASYRLAKENKQNHEMIEQDMIKVLSLIFFVKKNIPAGFNHQHIEKIEKECVAICNPEGQEEIISEASALCEYYMSTANLDI